MLKTHVSEPADRKAAARARQLSALLGERVAVELFPDAADEDWGIPTGVLLRARAEDALLFPAMLRDPGCGFLVFRLECERFSEIQADLCQTLSAWAESFQDREAGLACIARLDLPVGAEERERIADGFGSIINTLEIRAAYGSSTQDFADGSLVGFIHGGCEGFAGVLEQRFGLPAAEYTLANGLFPDEAVAQGFFAFPYLSGEGQEYARWLRAGMELSRQSRLCAFGGLSRGMDDFAPGARLHFLWDRAHSGIEIGDGEVIAYRGAQRIGPLALVAGHRETSACLALPGSRGEKAFICHGAASGGGAGEAVPFNLPALQRAASARCDTPKNYHTVARLEHVLRRYILQAGAEDILQPAAWLAPRINIQGKKRKPGAMTALPPPLLGETTLDDYRVELRAPFQIPGGSRTAVLVLDRNLPGVTDGLCNQLIERAVAGAQVTPFDLFVIESGSDRDRLSRYTTHHFVDDASVKVGLRIARGLNAGIRLLPGYEFYGFFTNDVVLTHALDTIATVQEYFDAYPRIGLIECLGTSAGFERWDARSRVGIPVEVAAYPLFYTPYPIIRALFLRGDLARKLSPQVLCPENWRNWGNDEDLGYRTWKAGYYVAASACLSIHEDAFLSTREHAQVRTEDVQTFKREAMAQMEAFISARYQTGIAAFRRDVFDTMLAGVDERLPVICSGNIIKRCTT
ncbi:MAG: hypothetical protein JXN59_02520 [Anaerolineae bacterium]|nr:hypothetical protein [Anaerolineae bacterium]